MVLRRKPDDEPQPRLLEVDASMTGTLTFKDPVNLQINGHFEGSLDVKGSLTIGSAAQVKATIHGESISIAGNVEGPIVASRRLELLPTARVVGKVTTPKLIMQEGAVLHGPCDMLTHEPDRNWMSLEELARYLEVDIATVRDWAQGGRLPGKQDGGQWWFDRARVEAWLAQEKIR